MPVERERLLRLIAEDAYAGLGDVFALSDEGPRVLATLEDHGDEPISSSTLDVLPWQWEVRHVGTLAGIPPTGLTVVLRAVTIVDVSGDEPVFHRFIDWLGLFDQLGASVITRPAVEEFPGGLPQRDRFGVLDHERVDGYGEASGA